MNKHVFKTKFYGIAAIIVVVICCLYYLFPPGVAPKISGPTCGPDIIPDAVRDHLASLVIDEGLLFERNDVYRILAAVPSRVLNVLAAQNWRLKLHHQREETVVCSKSPHSYLQNTQIGSAEMAIQVCSTSTPESTLHVQFTGLEGSEGSSLYLNHVIIPILGKFMLTNLIPVAIGRRRLPKSGEIDPYSALQHLQTRLTQSPTVTERRKLYSAVLGRGWEMNEAVAERTFAFSTNWYYCSPQTRKTFAEQWPNLYSAYEESYSCLLGKSWFDNDSYHATKCDKYSRR